MQQEKLATAISLHYLSAQVIITDIPACSDPLRLTRAMQFELSHDRQNITDEQILCDMRRVAANLCSNVLRQRDYNHHGKFAVKTAINRFGAWATAVERAGLEKSVNRQITESLLFENLFRLWMTFGRQPLYSELQKPTSKYNISTYERRFGSWRSALEVFVKWANTIEVDSVAHASMAKPRKRRDTTRQPDLRMRFRVLVRDRFTCCACGASPATTPGTNLEVDHRIAWSCGGETREDNLQTLCQRCNQGKSNLRTDLPPDNVLSLACATGFDPLGGDIRFSPLCQFMICYCCFTPTRRPVVLGYDSHSNK